MLPPLVWNFVIFEALMVIFVILFILKIMQIDNTFEIDCNLFFCLLDLLFVEISDIVLSCQIIKFKLFNLDLI